MGLEQIGKSILRDAGAEQARIIRRAERKAKEIRVRAEQKCEAIIADHEERARREGGQHAKEIIVASRLKARDAAVAVKQEVIDQSFAVARAKLEGLSNSKYERLAAQLIAECSAGGEEIMLDDAEVKNKQAVIDLANEIMKQNKKGSVVLSSERRLIGKGFITRRNLVEENHSFDQLFKTAREDLEAEIAAILLPGID